MLPDQPLNKRALGMALVAIGGVIALGTLAADWLEMSEHVGLGSVQRAGLMGGVALVLVGASLLPLGDRPA